MPRRRRIKAKELKDKEEDKHNVLKAKLLKIKLAVGGPRFPSTPEARRGLIQDTKNPSATVEGTNTQTQNRLRAEGQFINKKKPIRPKGSDAKISPDLKKRLAKIKTAKDTHDHGHTILMKGHTRGVYRSASLENQQGKYAKYWLLNAKQTNGNGWGIASHSAKQNMSKFIGRPLVVTSSTWHGDEIAGRYGKTFDHPYVPTNDLDKIFDHQEQYRVGNIVDIGEKGGDYYAMIEMLPKFANMTLPPFCSPAIYQLDAKEAEGQISKWEALHLAAQDENPAYGARIALLKGTCVGTNHECRVQFKSAKQKEVSIVCTKAVKSKLSSLKKKQKTAATPSRDEFLGEHLVKRRKELVDLISKGPAVNPRRTKTLLQDDVKHEPITLFTNKRNKKSIIKKDAERRRNLLITDSKLPGQGVFGDPPDTLLLESNKIQDHEFNLSPEGKKERLTRGQLTKFTPNTNKGTSLAKLKLKLASLGEQNMTYQESKKIKIHKKKHPEVRKAQSSVEDILRGSGRSVDGSHAQSTFLSTIGDFIGGSGQDTHTQQIDRILGTKTSVDNSDKVINEFSRKHSIPRVQTFPINREGVKATSIAINSPITKQQFKSIQDLEKGGRDIGFVINENTTGRGSRDLMKNLREQKLI